MIRHFIFDENGHKVMTLEDQKTGWHLADGDWYYVDNGTLRPEWKMICYYLENGKMLTNSLVPAKNTPGRYSYVGQDGTCVSGWVQRMNDWMYLEKDEKPEILLQLMMAGGILTAQDIILKMDLWFPIIL